MTLESFVDAVASLFPQVDPAEFSPETEFKKRPEWGSLLALSLIACVEDEFDVLLSGETINGAQTVRDLFDAARAQKNGGKNAR